MPTPQSIAPHRPNLPMNRTSPTQAPPVPTRSRRGTLAIAAGLALLAPCAFAAQQSFHVASDSATVNANTGQLAGTVLVPRFDPSLGQLASIDITLGFGIGGDVGFENRQAGAFNSLTYERPIQVEFQLPHLVLPIQQQSSLTAASGRLTSYDGALDFGGLSGLTITLPISQHSTSISVASDQQSAFVATAPNQTFDVAAALVAGTRQTGGTGAKSFSVVDLLSGRFEVDVVYTYTPTSGEVPEPGTWMAASALVAGGAFVAQRRRRTRGVARPHRNG